MTLLRAWLFAPPLVSLALQGCAKVSDDAAPDTAVTGADTSTSAETDTAASDTASEAAETSDVAEVGDALCGLPDSGSLAATSGPTNCVASSILGTVEKHCPAGSVCHYGTCYALEAFVGCALTPCGTVWCFAGTTCVDAVCQSWTS